jgi:lysophospholipase L1-like esterase
MSLRQHVVRGWQALGMLVVFLLTLEALCWGVIGIRSLFSKPEAGSGPRGPWAAEYNEEFSRVVVGWEPYVLWRSRPFQGRLITVDPDGLRHVANRRPPSAAPGSEPLRVWMFGGSTTWGFHCRDGHTIPDAVARGLQEAGVDAEVVNFGQIGYVTTQEVISLELALRERKPPDLVVFLDGFNDTFAAFSEGEAGVPMNEANRKREFNITKETGPFVAKALFAGLAKTGTGRFLLAVHERLLSGRPAPPAPAGLEAAILAVYRKNLGLADMLAREHGFATLFFWQPVVFLKPHLSEDEKALLAERESFMRFYRRVQEGLASDAPLKAEPRFHDLSCLFDAETGTVFVDYNHLVEEGYERARRIAQDAVPVLQSRPR